MIPAVIVAGGVASRLRPYSEQRPKSLMELEPGVTILSFVMGQLRRAGYSPIYIVTRKEFEKDFRSAVGGSAVVLTVDLEEFGNLYSVYTALRHVKTPFLVAMSDHIFEYEILARLPAGQVEKAFTLYLDREPSRAELQEGLKVRIEGGRVVDVGKTIDSNHGIDTGLILFGEGSAKYVERAIAEKGPGAAIADALSLAAREGQVDVVDITGLIWKDIDTPSDLVKARRLYKRILLRDYGRRATGAATQLLVRPLTFNLAARLSHPRRLTGAVLAFLFALSLSLSAAVLASLNPWALPPLAYALALAVDALGVLNAFSRGSLTGLGYAAELVAEAGLGAAILMLSAKALGSFPVPPAASAVLVSSALSAYSDFNGSPPRVVRLVADPTLKYVVASIAAPAGFEALGIAYWVAAGILLVPLALSSPRYTLLSAEAFPRVRPYGGFLRRRLEVAASSGVKLAAALLILSLVKNYVGDTVLVSTDWYRLRVGDALSVLMLLFIVYYGYRVLIGLKALVDAASARMAKALGTTESLAKRIGLDALYLAATALALVVATPTLRDISGIGDALYKVTSLALLAILLFLSYDLAKALYTAFEEALHSMLDWIVKSVEGREG